MKGPTKRQQAILDWIAGFISEHGMPPTVREIGRAFEIASSSVFSHLKALERKGLLRRGNLGPRSLEVLNQPSDACGDCVRVPLVGRIAAGAPTFASENVEGSITVDQGLVRGHKCFALRVKGDSMIEAGIFDGDIVVVHQQATVDDGEIAVCLVGGDEATLKRVYREPRGHVRLEPENRRMKAQVVSADDLLIQGKVIAVRRTLF